MMPDHQPETRPDPVGDPAQSARRVAERTAGLGMFPRPDPEPGFSPAIVIAVGLTLVWIVVIATYWFIAPDPVPGTEQAADPIASLMSLLAAALPIALIWVVAVMARTARALRDEAERLKTAIDALRSASINQQKASALPVRAAADRRAASETRIEDPRIRTAEGAQPTFASRRDHTQLPIAPDRRTTDNRAGMTQDDQPALALGPPSDEASPPVPANDYIRALNFPDSPDDVAAFQSLRVALGDRGLAKLIRAAQDVLTLLGQDGIYMDELHPDLARPEFWRMFAAGERGRAVAPLGGIRDRAALSHVAGRMRSDIIFRDAAHHFLRQFDRSFSQFAETASDQQITALSATRTARAFMLLGRVSGTFD